METITIQTTHRGFQVAVQSIATGWHYPAHFPARSEAETWARNYQARDLAWNQKHGRTFGDVTLDF